MTAVLVVNNGPLRYRSLQDREAHAKRVNLSATSGGRLLPVPLSYFAPRPASPANTEHVVEPPCDVSFHDIDDGTFTS